jgi:hypothetical protein
MSASSAVAFCRNDSSVDVFGLHVSHLTCRIDKLKQFLTG